MIISIGISLFSALLPIFPQGQLRFSKDGEEAGTVANHSVKWTPDLSAPAPTDCTGIQYTIAATQSGPSDSGGHQHTGQPPQHDQCDPQMKIILSAQETDEFFSQPSKMVPAALHKAQLKHTQISLMQTALKYPLRKMP